MGSAAAARDAYQHGLPSIIGSDIGLPGEDGYSSTRWKREWESSQNLSRIPAHALTAFARSEDHERALSAGYDSHLSRPIDPDELPRHLAETYARRHA